MAALRWMIIRLSRRRLAEIALTAILVVAVALVLTHHPKTPYYSCGMYAPTRLPPNTYYAGC
jgi:hypothetical protein